MRFKILLRIEGRLPISYSYYLGSFIFRSLAKEYEDIAAELHKSKDFKPYSFSRLLAKYEKRENGFLWFRKNTPATLYISSINDELMKLIIDVLLTQKYINIKGKNFILEGIERVDYPPLSFEFSTLSPVVVSVFEDGKRFYAKPHEEVFYQKLIHNLEMKYMKFFEEKPRYPPIIKIYNSFPRSRKIKNDWIGAWDLIGKISTSDEKMLKIIWDLGLGEKNGMGFGMVGLRRKSI